MSEATHITGQKYVCIDTDGSNQYYFVGAPYNITISILTHHAKEGSRHIESFEDVVRSEYMQIPSSWRNSYLDGKSKFLIEDIKLSKKFVDNAMEYLDIMEKAKKISKNIVDEQIGESYKHPIEKTYSKFMSGKKLFNEGYWNDALDIYLELLNYDSDNNEYHVIASHNVACCLFKKGCIQEATMFIEESVNAKNKKITKSLNDDKLILNIDLELATLRDYPDFDTISELMKSGIS